MSKKKLILHLCADIGSDTYPYSRDSEYEVIKIGKDIGVENYAPPKKVHGVIANPVCTEFSTARGFHKKVPQENGLFLVEHCLRVIDECSPSFWMLENPAMGRLKDHLGKPAYTYQPWQYGSPWTKKTGLWGSFRMPPVKFKKWDDVPKNDKLYVRPGRGKPSLAFLHKSAVCDIREFHPFIDLVKTDADFRSLCSQGFAISFKESNP